jgi:uncharacterized protein (TIGR04222 family)
MWPFDLRGPDFLLFYVVVSTMVITAVALLRHLGEPEDTPKVNLADPYLIAFLRGGKNESLRVVTMSLVDRGLLAASGTKLATCEGAWGKACSELERKIVRHFTPSAEASSLFKTPEAAPEMLQYENELTRLGLLPDVGMKQARLLRTCIGLFTLLGLAVTKIYVALTTGHKNIQFLIVLMIAVSIGTAFAGRARRTRAGDRMIEDLRTMCEGLKQRSSQLQNGASPAEFALMAAVFGMSTVPYAKTLFPQSGSAGCGSSCGSSGDGGSSCGGGGCGGCGGG